MNGRCKLCLNTTELRLSHVVPKFVWRWLKESAISGIRTNRNPNRRIQDGAKDYFLCAECEQRLSAWEKPFCEKVFLPLHDPAPVIKPLYYKEWALKFAASISWRVLTFYEKEAQNSDFTPLQHELVSEALDTWRKFMLGERENPGNFTQHLLPLDVIKSYQGPKISPFLNRYNLRAIHIDVISTKYTLYVYTKMCRLVIFGRIQEEHPHLWKGMQLHLRRGEIRPRSYHLPASIADYMNRKADEARSALGSISPQQQAIVDAAFDKEADIIANSEAFRAMNFDVFHSGEEAFSKRKR